MACIPEGCLGKKNKDKEEYRRSWETGKVDSPIAQLVRALH